MMVITLKKVSGWGTLMDSTEWTGKQPWDSDEHVNATNAIALAEKMLADMKRPVTNGLDGLQGYKWGGTW